MQEYFEFEEMLKTYRELLLQCYPTDKQDFIFAGSSTWDNGTIIYTDYSDSYRSGDND